MHFESSDAADLLATASSLLFLNGQSSESTEATIRRFGAALGVEADVLLRWGEVVLFVSNQRVPIILPAKPTTVDMGRVAAVLHIIDEVEAGRMDPGQARAALDGITRMPPVSVVRFAALAAAGAAALGVIFGATTAATLAVIALSAGGGALLRRAVSHLTHNALAQPFCAALLAGVAGVLAIRADIGVDPRLVLVCPCMVLVPGPHVLNGTIDLARARITIGSARLMFAGLLVLMICAGLLLGLTAGDISLPAAGPATVVPWYRDMAAAGLAVAAYGTFFNMPWRVLPVPVLVGMAAHGARWLLLTWGVSLAAASLAACLIVGVLVTVLADRLRYPFAAFGFASVVSMVPGVFLFESAAALVELTAQGVGAPARLVVEAVVNGISALLIILAMTVGLIVPKMAIEGWRPPRARDR
ncbi:threonine/serine exporter family protein [Xanthobacter sp. V4C-4]|uniref:threonine/serine ThrE exporter family protein n=1 Tax=Xanthobacter cornucopiae TaxID=3119924 RepID=UPI0037277D22